MVSLIKNQLLKHLSRFTKNLSADKINLSTFKGEGELSNLELNEIVLTDLLELPSWLRLTSALCNKVTFRIPWTKLKNIPIHLSLDEVNIIVETCEELRSMSAQGGLSSYTAVPGKYSFIHKVIDGMTVTVNTVNITFNSPAFTANVQISRIVVESKSPEFKKEDLRMTRIKDPEKGQLLIFKELEWQTLRLEAKSTVDKNLTPLRLLTNQARCRITIKKRLSDSFIMGSTLAIILDKLLWVLTDSQLKAALHFLDSLAGLVQKATQITRKAKAARKLEELPEYQAQVAQQARAKEKTSAISNIFKKYDVIETSYHFLAHHIDLHFCDDPGAGRSSYPSLKDGGALQITVQCFQVDYYPYHLVKADRKHWPRYREANIPHTQWLEQSFNSFRTKFLDLLERNRGGQHTPLSRANKTPTQQQGDSSTSSPSTPTPTSQVLRSPGSNPIKNFAVRQFAKLMTMCIVMRVEDFTMYKVTTSGKKQALREFISGDRDRISLQENSNIVHAEFTYFYYPEDTPFPLPPPKFYVQLNPIQISFDVESILWFNSFALNLHHSLLSSKKVEMENVSNLTYIDVKIEAILPKVSFESGQEYHNQRDRPKQLSFQVTRATITNVRSLEQSSRADLAKCIDSFHMGSLFFGSEFPSNPNDFYIVTQKFLDHISTTDNIRTLPKELDTSSEKVLLEQVTRELLWTEAKDIWCISLDPVWGDFVGARAVGSNKPVPFLDNVSVTIWLHTHLDPNSTIKTQAKDEENRPKNADIHALAHIANLVSVQLNHYQFLFLRRLAEEAGELATFLSIDSNRILNVESNGSLVVGALIPQLEVTFVMPSQNPGKESSGGDVESFIPDSSSIPDDILAGSTATVWQNSTLSITQADMNASCGGGGMIFNSSNAKIQMANGRNNVQSFHEYSGQSAASTSSEFVGEGDHFETISSSSIPTSTTKNQAPVLSNLPNNFNESFKSMRKGFSNLMTSIDILKPSSDDASDSVSIRSGSSSDSENFVVVNYGNEDADASDAMFFVPEFQTETRGIVEMASEVIEEESTMTTASDPSLPSSCKRKDLVSVSTFRLTKVEFLQQSVGYSSSIKVQVDNLTNEDCNSIPWDEFQSKFSSRGRAWSYSPSNENTTTRVKLRMDHELTLPSSKSMNEMDFSDKNQLKKMFKDNVVVQVSDLNLDLLMSTVTGLADLIEDEIIAPPLPLEITLDNIQLHLIEDRPPVNITSPGPVPINLDISHLFITQGEDGVFRIVPNRNSMMASSASSLSGSLHRHQQQSQQSLNHLQSQDSSEVLRSQVNRQLRLDNEELKRRLAAFERVSMENCTLRRAKEETDILRSCLTSAQEEVSRLLDEKRKLLDEIRRLQELQIQERSRQWSNKR